MNTKAKRPTADDISRRMTADKERKRLENEARQQKKIVEEVDGRVMAYMQNAAKATTKFGDFRATRETIQGRIAWQDVAMGWKPEDAPMPTGKKKDKLTFGPA